MPVPVSHLRTTTPHVETPAVGSQRRAFARPAFRAGARPAAASTYDVVLLGTFSAWKLGTLQARALPQAAALQAQGLRCAVLTVPWDQPSERGVRNVVGGVPLLNTASASVTQPLGALREMQQRLRAWQPRAIQIVKPRGFGGLVASQVLTQRERPLVLVDADDWEGDGGWNRVGSYGLLQRRVFHWQEQSLLRTADAVTTASRILQHRAMQVRTQRHGAAPLPHDVTYLPNGLQPDWLRMLSPSANAEAARDERQQRGPLELLLYSRFEEIGPDWAPHVAAELATRGVRVRFTVVGETAISGDGQPGVDVRRMGYVARESLPALLTGADIALLPLEDSLVGRAKNSVKLLELMAAGCVTVASGVGDVPETLGTAGAIVPSGDPSAFAQAISDLVAQPERLRRMRAVASARVRQQFQYPNVAEPLVLTYAAHGIVRA